MYQYLRTEGWMPTVETNRAKVVNRLVAEEWENAGGSNHGKFRKAGRPSIIVPRHRTLSPGVARSIARAAGWM
jgi:hypothetical protein